MSDLVERLREACTGHPHAKIAWPHRILHEAADAIATHAAEITNLKAEIERLEKERDESAAERDLLQDVLDSRPAINAGLPDTYIRWSQSIYSGDAIRAALTNGGAA